jgi:hypothetical protein
LLLSVQMQPSVLPELLQIVLRPAWASVLATGSVPTRLVIALARKTAPVLLAHVPLLALLPLAAVATVLPKRRLPSSWLRSVAPLPLGAGEPRA